MDEEINFDNFKNKGSRPSKEFNRDLSGLCSYGSFILAKNSKNNLKKLNPLIRKESPFTRFPIKNFFGDNDIKSVNKKFSGSKTELRVQTSRLKPKFKNLKPIDNLEINGQKEKTENFNKVEYYNIKIPTYNSESYTSLQAVRHQRQNPKQLRDKCKIIIDAKESKNNLVKNNLDFTKNKNNKFFPGNLNNKLFRCIQQNNCNIRKIEENKIEKNNEDSFLELNNKIKFIYNLKNIYCSATIIGREENNKSKDFNQDNSIILQNIGGIENFNIYGIMDGHGTNGHMVSKFIKDEIEKYFTKNFLLNLNIKKTEEDEKVENIYNNIKTKLTKNNYHFIINLYEKLNNNLNSCHFDAHFSGTTCVLIFQIKEEIITANVGDSRAMIINYNEKEKEYNLIQLSFDHKPENPIEKDRILSLGGVISQKSELDTDKEDLEGEPYRVWVRGCGYPGISMSRSLGDSMSKSIGVICEPEIINFKLDNSSFAFILGSDGVFQFLQNEKLLKSVLPYLKENDLEKACKTVICESTKLWNELAENVDDITISIIKI